MFGLLNATQIQSIPQQQQELQQQERIIHIDFDQKFDPYHQDQHQHQLSPSSKSPSPLTRKFFTRNTASLLEKFLQTDFLHKVYDPLKNYKHLSNEHNSYVKSKLTVNAVPIIFHGQRGKYYPNLENEKTLNCHRTTDKTEIVAEKTPTMTIKCSKNLLAVETAIQSPATLQNYQKISEADSDLVTDVLVPSSGASSGEFNCSSDTTTTSASSSATNAGNNAGRNSSSATNSSSSLYKRFGGRISSVMKATTEARTQGHKAGRDTALKTSITLNHSRNSLNNIALKSNDLQRSSSSSSAGDYLGKRERKKGAMTPQPQKTPLTQLFSSNCPAATATAAAAAAVELDGNNSGALLQTSTGKLQRRKLMQFLTALDQQNKLLQRELAKEKRRRSEELACVVKSLICFEAKLKADMKSANEQLLERDMEICRLVQQNRALRQHIHKLNEAQNNRDEGVVADGDVGVIANDGEIDLNEDCLVLEALQCINCRQQFHDIRYNKQGSQTLEVVKEHGNQNNDDPTSEHCSSSDDTASSSFFGARRSVRYTSKRTSGTFRDYMHSRAMNIDHPTLENCNNTLEFNDTSYEKLNLFSRTIERMHGVKSESERDSEQSGLDSSTTRSASRTSTKSSKSSLSSADKVDKVMNNVAEEDDGIFLPTLDDDYEEDDDHHHHQHQQQQQAANLNNLERTTVDLSEDTPKQVYETSTDDWYASASDQDEITGTAQNQCYSQGAVNPVLECVNQILIQQSMEGPEEQTPTHKTANPISLPRRSSLSDSKHSRQNSTAGGNNTPNSRNGTLTRKRVHFSTKNSMVHVPRNDDLDLEDDDDNEINGSVDNGNNQVMPMANRLISNFQEIANYIVHSPPLNEVSMSEERLEALNYESIYSNEYEPIGSEMNSSNLYMDMDTGSKSDTSFASTLTDVDDINKFNGSNNKLPPALPPKPANLLKFKKSLQQLNESADESTEAQTSNDINETSIEPDYCSISEVNVGITNVQITADVHQAPLSESDLEFFVKSSEMDIDRHSTVVSASDAGSQKTEEIEEIFADIPKLPNVAAIIAPKSSINFQTSLQNNYIMMSPNVKENLNDTQKELQNAKLNLSPMKTIKSENINSGSPPQHTSTPANNKQYKRKHIPNIIMEINKRTSTSTCGYLSSSGSNNDFQKYNTNTNMNTNTNTNSYSKSNITETEVMQNLPIQAEFDWYNLDAEYGRFGTIDMMNVNEAYNPVKISMLAEIQEDGESIATTADEYNLDDEFAQELETEKQMKLEMEREREREHEQEREREREREKENECESDKKRKIDTENTLELIIQKHQQTSPTDSIVGEEMESSSSSSSSASSTSIKQKETDSNLTTGLQKANKIKNNLANFEKFIENSGLSTKPLPTKRRIYYAEPFV